MYLGSTRNDAGTVVHSYRCDRCSTVFTVTGIGQVINRPCRLTGCPSYEADLDIDAALAKGPVQLKRGDGQVVTIPQRPLDEKRKEFLQRTGNRRHPVVVIRVVQPKPVSDEPSEVNFIAATCETCNTVREFRLDTPLRSAEEIRTWLTTQLTPCTECHGTSANIAMRLDPREAPAN